MVKVIELANSAARRGLEPREPVPATGGRRRSGRHEGGFVGFTGPGIVLGRPAVHLAFKKCDRTLQGPVDPLHVLKEEEMIPRRKAVRMR